jgi:hypothetical protein
MIQKNYSGGCQADVLYNIIGIRSRLDQANIIGRHAFGISTEQLKGHGKKKIQVKKDLENLLVFGKILRQLFNTHYFSFSKDLLN